MEGGQQVLRLEWMEVEEVAAAGKSAERLVDAWRVWPVVKNTVNEAHVLSSTYLAKEGV